MSWFVAKVVYRIVCGNGEHTPQYEEQLRLIDASSKSEAFKKALKMGIKEEVQFLNQQQKLVHWKFIDVSELYQLHEVADGTEIYSRIEEKDDADIFEVFVHAKASFILEEANQTYLQPI